MNVFVFILLFIIMLGLIYLVHRYLGKSELYLLALIYSILSFIMSFKMIDIFGIYINGSVIFSTGLIIILYYFINRYNKKEIKRLINSIILSICFADIIILINGLIEPSLYNNNFAYFRDMLVNNYMIFILYPISTYITLRLSSYVFNSIKGDSERDMVYIILLMLGIIFVDVFIFIYFSYGITLGFIPAFMIAFGNYIIKTIMVIGSIYIIDMIIKTKKVKL